MEQFPRSCCLYHPGQIITNFCTDKACLMPLCPTCICTHSATHPNGKPNLSHINDVFASCLREIQEMILDMEGNRLAAELVNRKINDERQSWTDMIDKTKFQAMDMVNNFFEQFKKQVELGREKQNRMLGLHVPERMKQIEKKISEHTAQLMEMKTDLFNERCLSTLITFYHENKNEFSKAQINLHQQIKSNDLYSPVLVLQPDAFQKLKASLMQFFTLNLGTLKPQRQIIRAQSPPPFTNPIASLMQSPAQSPIQSAHPSNQTSRVLIESPFKNISNYSTTYPPVENVSTMGLSLPLQSNSFKANKTSNNTVSPSAERSPRSSLGIKLMAQTGSQSMKRKKSPIQLRRNPQS